MSFLRLFLLVFFLSFCGEKKSEKNAKDDYAQKNSKKKSKDFVYIVAETADLPECEESLERKVYFVETEEKLKVCSCDKKTNICSYEAIEMKGNKGENGAKGEKGPFVVIEKSINTLPEPVLSVTQSGLDLVLTMTPHGSSKIFYTDDASTPTSDSTVYGPDTITLECCDSKTYKAFQTHWLFSDSDIATYNFSFFYEFDFSFGTEGDSEGEFRNPTGVAIDSEGKIYVLDYIRQNIQKFSANGDYIRTIGSSGDGDGQFLAPRGIFIDSENNIYVADSSRSDVQKFDSNGDFVFEFGSYGTENGQFLEPRGIVVSSSGDIYVLDSGRQDIQVFTEEGVFDFKFGSYGTEEGEFLYPFGMAIDSSGNVYVIDDNRYDVQKFDSNGDFLLQFGEEGEENGQFDNPVGIATDSRNNIYVLDSSGYNVQKFDSSGYFISKFGSEGEEEEEEEGTFLNPVHLAINSRGDDSLYILDDGRDNVQKFFQINQ